MSYSSATNILGCGKRSVESLGDTTIEVDLIIVREYLGTAIRFSSCGILDSSRTNEDRLSRVYCFVLIGRVLPARYFFERILIMSKVNLLRLIMRYSKALKEERRITRAISESMGDAKAKIYALSNNLNLVNESTKSRLKSIVLQTNKELFSRLSRSLQKFRFLDDNQRVELLVSVFERDDFAIIRPEPGTFFDPQFHEPTNESDSDIVSSMIKPGLSLGGKCLIPSLVELGGEPSL